MADGFVVFLVHGRRYRIAAADVEEIVPATTASIRSMPGSAHGVRGVFGYGDRSVPLIDLGILLAAGPTALTAESCVLVCHLEEGTVRGHGPVGMLLEGVLAVPGTPGEVKPAEDDRAGGGQAPGTDTPSVTIQSILSRLAEARRR